MKNSAMTFVKQFSLLITLFGFVLGVNWSVITFDMMYPEQPLFYSVNQSIHSLSDLLKVYLHPALMDTVIPFFRPSGHFLVYQIFAPILGWHNTKGFIGVNLFFLALSGYFMVRLYALLFPRYAVGGYIAFAVYLMQPALAVSRIVIMHFEFAYVAFLLMSLYFFVLFCQKNLAAANHAAMQKIKFNDMYLLGFTILFFVIAVTFKESAIMLGPVLASYFCIVLYRQQSWRQYLQAMLSNKEILEILFLLTIMSIVLAAYLISAWPTLTHPLRAATKGGEVVGSINEFLKMLLGIQHNFLSRAGLFTPEVVWRNFVTPVVTRVVVWSLWLLSVCCAVCVFSDKTNSLTDYKKSLLFLYLACLLFMVLPVGWAIGFPWHLSLSLMCLSFIMGFGFEFVALAVLKNPKKVMLTGAAVAVLIGLTTMQVDIQNIKKIVKSDEQFIFQLNRNAIFKPPNIKNQLNADSVVVVENRVKYSDYYLGNSRYPYIIPLQEFKFDSLNPGPLTFSSGSEPIYNGRLFRWAYLLPDLHEEVFPFDVNHMKDVPDEVIYDWLQHANNIFCLGYDKNAQWYDRTIEFKKNLFAEQSRRHLISNHYNVISKSGLASKVVYSETLPYADFELCQAKCDLVKTCQGFTYIFVKVGSSSLIKCHYYDKLLANSSKPCKVCTSYIKA